WERIKNWPPERFFAIRLLRARQAALEGRTTEARQEYDRLLQEAMTKGQDFFLDIVAAERPAACRARAGPIELLERGTMTTGGRAQESETLLRKDRKSRTARQAEQLRAHVEELLSTPEGRKSIQDRFGDSRPFQGKGWFLNEVVRTVDGARAKAAALTSSERQVLLLGLLP